MINWLQVTLQKHFKWLLVILLVVIIGPFVLYVGPAGIMPDFGGRREVGFFGYNLASEASMRPAFLSTAVSQRLASGRDSIPNDQLTDQTYQRIALLALADELHLPTPTTDDPEFMEFARSLSAFRNSDGVFDQQRFDDLREELQASALYRNMEITLSRILREDFRIQQAREALVGPGFYLPFEARRQVIDAETEWSVNVVTVPFSTYEPTLELSDEEIENYFADNSFRYEQPETLIADYILFPNTNYVDRVEQTPTEEELQSHFETISWRFRPPVPAAVEDAPDPVLEDYRDETLRSWKSQFSRRLAQEAADTFAYTLYAEEIPYDSPRVMELVEELGGQDREIGAVRRGSAPFASNLTAEQVAPVFDLPANRYYSDPIVTGVGAYVILRKEIQPAQIPPLEEVRTRVEIDLRAERRRERFNAYGAEVREQLAAMAAAGAPLTDAENLPEDATVRTFGDFTMQNPPSEFPRPVLSQLPRLAEGEVSSMVFANAAGLFVHLEKKDEPDLEELTDRLAQAEEQVQTLSRIFASNSMIGEMITQEVEASGINQEAL